MKGRSIAILTWWLTALLAAAQAPAPEPPPVDDDSSPYHLALTDYKTGNLPQALTEIEAAEAQKPADPFRTEMLKARILSELGRFDEAKKILNGLTGATPAYEQARQLALGDLALRARHFDEASKIYDAVLAATPDDSDVILKDVYARVSTGDLLNAGKLASELKPLDPIHPGYYFAQAAIHRATNQGAQAEQDIATVRTIYGITVANRYLKTYLQVFVAPDADVNTRLNPPGAAASPATAEPAKP